MEELFCVCCCDFAVTLRFMQIVDSFLPALVSKVDVVNQNP